MLGFTWEEIGRYTLEVTLVVLASSFAFDVIHWTLHQLEKSPRPLLRWVGGLHGIHHVYWDRELRFHDELWKKNVVMHHLPEYATQMMVASTFYLWLDWIPVAITQGILTFVFAIVLAVKGKDLNHRPIEVLDAPRNGLVVNASYHAMHHIFPERYFGSYVTAFDRLFGTGCQIEGRRFVVTGASGSFGAPLCRMLTERGAASVVTLKFGADWDYDDVGRADQALKDADVLVLAHGSKRDQAMAANCTSFVAFIERFKKLHAHERFPPEVWATGSEIESHPHFGVEELKIYKASKDAYALHARRYYRDPRIVYRHIVPSAFTSRMGPGLITGERAAAIALFFIRRGFRYVPVTYTGIALLNFVKFLFAPRAASAATPAIADRSMRATLSPP